MLDPSYIEYPLRRYGPDHDLFPWSCLFDRTPILWRGGRRVAVAIFVNLEHFPLTPVDVPFRAPSHMQTPFPDLRNFSSRDYGVRVGFYRMLDLFQQLDLRVSVAVNSAIAERYPSVIGDIVACGHEIVAHSVDMNGTIATGLAEADEKALIETSLAVLQRVAGARPRGWLSIARSQSWNTPRLLAEAGVDYMCDWVNDEMPYAMTTASGPIANLPLNHELGDRQILLVQQHSMDSYVEQIRDAYDWLDGEAARSGGGRLLPLNLTPYVTGLPYRISGLRDLLEGLRAEPNAVFLTGSDIIDDWRAAAANEPG